MEYDKNKYESIGNDDQISSSLIFLLEKFVKERLVFIKTCHYLTLTASDQSKYSQHIIIRLFDFNDREIIFTGNGDNPIKYIIDDFIFYLTEILNNNESCFHQHVVNIMKKKKIFF